MGKIVGGFLMPHNPLMFTNPRGASEEQKERVSAAYNAITRRIGELQATTAIIIGVDHYILFGPKSLPTIQIAVGELDGPIERLKGMERSSIPHNPVLAEHVMQVGFDEEFDWSVAKVMSLDHSTAIPYFKCIRPHPNMSVLPIYLACGVQPIIRISRARALGGMLRNAVTTASADERVVVIGSGGISHWVGEAEMGRVNPDFDHEILNMVKEGDLDALCSLSDDYVVGAGGNGALEIRTFACAMAAAGAVRGEVIEYEPVRGWITGMGFAELFSE